MQSGPVHDAANAAEIEGWLDLVATSDCNVADFAGFDVKPLNPFKEWGKRATGVSRLAVVGLA